MSVAPAFTILLPVVRPPAMLPFAIASVLQQQRTDFELHIICDGAPAETVAAARDAMQRDARVHAHVFPKGERHGEAHRDVVLQQARGRMVCQIGDDDLWLPDHLDEMSALLDEFEFGNLLQLSVTEHDQVEIVLEDLARPDVQRRMRAERFNIFGPIVAGYRLETYRRLSPGWSPAAAGEWTDLAMWRKFLALPSLRAGTRYAITSIHFAASQRRDWTLVERAAEAARYAARTSTPAGAATFRAHCLRSILAPFAGVPPDELAELAGLRGSRSWRLTAPLRAAVAWARSR